MRTTGLAFSLLCSVACTSGGGSADASSGTSSGGTESSSGDGDTSADGADLPPPDHYYLFLAGPFSGDLVGTAGTATARAAADQLCAAEYDAQWAGQLDCAGASALVATSAGGAPVSAPGDYALVASARVLSAPTDADLGAVGEVFTGTLAMSLADAGLFPDAMQDRRVWTGANDVGNFGALACQDWASADAAEQGLAGDGNQAAGWWSGSSVSCASEHTIACLCH